MQGQSPAEIARELGIKRNAADAILHRARRSLASKLGPRTAWGVVALPFTRLRTNVRHALHTLASWSPGSVDAAPLGVSLASAGLVAILTVTSPTPAPAVERPVTPQTDVDSFLPSDGRAAGAKTTAESTRGASATDVAKVDAPPYKISSRGLRFGEGSTNSGGGDIGVTYDPDSRGRGPLDDLLEPAIRGVTQVKP